MKERHSTSLLARSMFIVIAMFATCSCSTNSGIDKDAVAGEWIYRDNAGKIFVRVGSGPTVKWEITSDQLLLNGENGASGEGRLLDTGVAELESDEGIHTAKLLEDGTLEFSGPLLNKPVRLKRVLR